MKVQADPPIANREPNRLKDMFFEDFEVGDVFTGGHRTVTETDLNTMAELSGDHHPVHTDDETARDLGLQGKVLHGPFGQAAFLGWLFEAGLSQHATVMLDMQWEYLQVLTPGDEISFKMTITSKSRSASKSKGALGRDIEILNGNEETVQRGTSKVLVQARSDGSEEDLVPWAYCTVAWGERLAQALKNNDTFQRATATWDGAIGLASDQREIILRIYCGNVIYVGTRVPLGPTFTFTAGDKTWTEMLSAETNDFMVRAMKGQFSIHGNAYEYVRLTKTVMSIVGSARTLIKEEN